MRIFNRYLYVVLPDMEIEHRNLVENKDIKGDQLIKVRPLINGVTVLFQEQLISEK